MKLWILKPVEPLPAMWIPWYDKVFGFVVRASNEEEARIIAADLAGDEDRDINPWLYSKYATCEELLPEGKAGPILIDTRSA